MKQRQFVSVVAVICLLLGIWIVWSRQTADKTAPVISFDDKEITYDASTDKNILLDGVTATDDVDGDVSNTLVVDRVVHAEGNEYATVYYFAYDKSNNVASKSRNVIYLSHDGTSNDNAVGEDQNNQKKHDIVISIQEGIPTIALKTNMVTIQNGDPFDPLDYVASIVASSEKAQIIYPTSYTTRVPGTYTIQYYVRDEDGLLSNVESLILVVN